MWKVTTIENPLNALLINASNSELLERSQTVAMELGSRGTVSASARGLHHKQLDVFETLWQGEDVVFLDQVVFVH